MENISESSAGPWLSLPFFELLFKPNPHCSNHEPTFQVPLWWLSSPWRGHPIIIFTTFLAVYVALCRSLRYYRKHALRRKFQYGEGSDRAALARMTADEAQQIIRHLAGYEFPMFHMLSLEFALFKVSSRSTLPFYVDRIYSRRRYVTIISLKVTEYK